MNMFCRAKNVLIAQCIRSKSVPILNNGCQLQNTRIVSSRTYKMIQSRSISSSITRYHGTHDHDDEATTVSISASAASIVTKSTGVKFDSNPVHVEFDDEDDEDDADYEDMVALGPAGKEWGGPTRGGKFKEPTRFGDWERKGRCSDF